MNEKYYRITKDQHLSCVTGGGNIFRKNQIVKVKHFVVGFDDSLYEIDTPIESFAEEVSLDIVSGDYIIFNGERYYKV